MGTAIKHPLPDRVKLSFVIFVVRALSCSAVSVSVSGCQKIINNDLTRHRMLFSCTHVTTVGVKGLTLQHTAFLFCSIIIGRGETKCQMSKLSRDDLLLPPPHILGRPVVLRAVMPMHGRAVSFAVS